MYRRDILDTLLEGDHHEAACAYLEEFVDCVPRNEQEARECVALAADLLPALARARLPKQRTVAALIELRKLEREARDYADPCEPPQKLEERILRSLIAYMARPVLVKE